MSKLGGWRMVFSSRIIFDVHRYSQSSARPGLTFIELILGMAVVVILAGVTVTAINPIKNFFGVQSVGRTYRAQQIERAFFQYIVDQYDYPGDKNIPEGEGNAKPICRYGKTVGGCINIDELIPRYITCMPFDEAETNQNYSGYEIYLDSGRGNVFSTYEDQDSAAGGGCEPFPEPIAYWKLDESTGGTAADETGDHDGAYIGSSTASTDTPSAGFTFDNPYSRKFNGSQHVDMDDFTMPEDTIAVMAWIKWETSTTEPTIIARADNPDYWWKLGINDNDDEILFRLHAGGSETAYSKGSIDLDTWTHVAATYNESRMCIYKDGEQAGCQSKSGALRTGGAPDVWIGDAPSSASAQRFDGWIDDVRIYTEPLSQGQIEVIATGGT